MAVTKFLLSIFVQFTRAVLLNFSFNSYFYVDLEIGSNKKQIEFGVNWRFCWGQKPFVSSHVQKSEVATADWQRKLARLVSANRQDVFYCRDQILLRVLRRGRTESMNQDLAMLGRRYLPFTAIWIDLCIIVLSFPNFSTALLKVKIGTYVYCMYVNLQLMTNSICF